MQALTGKIRAKERGAGSAPGELLLAFLLAVHRGSIFHPALRAGRSLLAGVGQIRLQGSIGPSLLCAAGRPDAAGGAGLTTARFGG